MAVELPRLTESLAGYPFRLFTEIQLNIFKIPASIEFHCSLYLAQSILLFVPLRVLLDKRIVKFLQNHFTITLSYLEQKLGQVVNGILWPDLRHLNQSRRQRRHHILDQVVSKGFTLHL